MKRTMNNSEFKYFVLNTARVWQEGYSESVRVGPEGGVSLWPEQALTFLSPLREPTAFVCNMQGTLFVLDARSGLLYKYVASAGEFEPILCFGGRGILPGQFSFLGELAEPLRYYSPEPMQGLGGMALSRSRLFIADSFNHRIQVFFSHNYQLNFILGTQDHCGKPVAGGAPSEFCLPKDILLDSQGHFYVLDFGNRRIQKFDRFGRFLQFIGPEHLSYPVNMAMATDDCLYVVDAQSNAIMEFDTLGNLRTTIGDFSRIHSDFQPAGLAVDREKRFYIGEKGERDDLRIYAINRTGRLLGAFARYAGSCYQIQAGGENERLFANCGHPRRLLALDGALKFVSSGVYFSKAFDSNASETQWHRIVLDAEIAEKTKIEVSYFASDFEKEGRTIPADRWQPVLSLPRNGLQAQDGLFLNASGRFLLLRIQMFGDGAHSPTIREAKIYFPKLSLLRYLPATYQDDSIGRQLMDRFLALFESFSFDLEQQIAHLARHFDPGAVDEPFLSWLSTWLAISVDQNWTQEQKRQFVQKAYELYKKRGTLNGLQAMIRMFTGQSAIILEHFRLRRPSVIRANSTVGISTVVGKRALKKPVVGETTRIGKFGLNETEAPPQHPFQEDAFDFTIILDTHALSDIQLRSLRHIIEQEKPAHTRCFLCTSSGAMKLGVRSFVNIDTTLVKGIPFMQLSKRSRLGLETLLGTKYPVKGTMGARSSLGVDTLLH